MIRRIMLYATLIFSTLFSAAQNRNPIPVIFDSDMGPDYDDVGAITMLHAFADSGYIDIVATVACTRYEGVAAVFNVLNTYFNRPGLPIGVPRHGVDKKDWQHWTDSLIARYPHEIKKNVDVPDAVHVYRKALASLPDQSVVIITVGFFTNLSDLLQSGPDTYSALNGRELVKRKVKQLVSMAGRFPEGKEFNIEMDVPAAQYVANHWPTPILFSGFEIGAKIKTGLPLVRNESISNSPVKDVFSICLPMSKEDYEGRKSWDETAVWVAVKGVAPFYTTKSGKIFIQKDGKNGWHRAGKSQSYLIEKTPSKEVEQLLNQLLAHQPMQPSKK
jgi:inosine-uridine nucleoside N-ribohydrolase